MMLWAAAESRSSCLLVSIILVLGVARALFDRELQHTVAREHEHAGDEDKAYAKHNGHLPRQPLRKQDPRAFGDRSRHGQESSISRFAESRAARRRTMGVCEQRAA
jgi:hypothetical protein